MSYSVQKCERFFEIQVWGDTSKYEVLQIIRELDRRDRGKTCADLWILPKDSIVPFVHFRDIAEAIKGLLPHGATGNKSALVAGDAFHMSQLEMFQAEAAILPFEVRVFLSRDEAVAWLTADLPSQA